MPKFARGEEDGRQGASDYQQYATVVLGGREKQEKMEEREKENKMSTKRKQGITSSAYVQLSEVFASTASRSAEPGYEPLQTPPKKGDDFEREEEWSVLTPGQYEWDAHYQHLIADMRAIRRAGVSSEEKLPTYSALASLTANFIHTASTYGMAFLCASEASLQTHFFLAGKVLIAEAHLPIDEKTIKPKDLGGTLGGQKFMIHSDILFKACDGIL